MSNSGSIMNRRTVLGQSVAALSLSFGGAQALASSVARARAKIVVVGGGFAGATCAREVKRLSPELDVTLVEAARTYTACPFSNEVIIGARDLSRQRFDYDAVAKAGVTLRFATAIGIDQGAVVLDDKSRLPFDRAIIAPGVDLRVDAVPGYDQAAIERMPHAWKAGPQTDLFRRQIASMEDGGTFVMAVPANPYRCPPGPYERAGLIAHYFKRHKPKSKVIVLDAKDAFSKQKLFQQAWANLYPDQIEWIGLSGGGKVISVDPRTMTLATDFGEFKAAVANVIPPQRAGAIAEAMGLVDRSGWCPIDPVSFESSLRSGVHVIGDAAIAGAMPKSAFAANAQAKACALAVVTLLAGGPVTEPRLINTCYSLAAPDYGFSIAGVYRPADGLLADVPGAGGTSPLDAPADIRVTEAEMARGWFNTITADVFG